MVGGTGRQGKRDGGECWYHADIVQRHFSVVLIEQHLIAIPADRLTKLDAACGAAIRTSRVINIKLKIRDLPYKREGRVACCPRCGRIVVAPTTDALRYRPGDGLTGEQAIIPVA